MKVVGQANGHGLQQDQIAQTAMNAASTPITPANNAGVADFGQLGATFNDATRTLVGGLWQNAVSEGGQGLGSVHHYVDDLHTMRQGLRTEIKDGQFTGDTLTQVQTILHDLSKASAAATASVNGGGSFGSVAAAEKVLHDSHLDVLNIVNSNPTLHALATQNDAQGFLAAPPALADGVTPRNAPHADLAQIGAIFDDFANKTLGGVNASDQQALTHEVRVMASDLRDLMQTHPDQFQGLTGVHAETVVRQLHLEEKFIHDATTSPDAGRASNDNILDIIDIVQGDENLAHMANNGTVSGFTPFGDALNPTPKYIDNHAQTNFWSNFIAQSNSLGDKAIELVSSGHHAGTAGLVADLKHFQQQATAFDAAQGGIFEARFDNELLGKSSTLGAEVSKMIEGLRTGNATLVHAAADEMHANAADVSGNNIPTGGGTYNTDGRTVADVLSTAAGGQVASNTHGQGNDHKAGQAQVGTVSAVDADGAQHHTDAHVVANAAPAAAAAPAVSTPAPAPAQPAQAAQSAAQSQPAHTVATEVHHAVDPHDAHALGFAHMWA